MSTALEIIKDSLSLIGIIDPGEPLESEEANSALRYLNRMLQSWNTKNLVVNGVVIESFSLVGGQSSYTLGTGGDFDTDNPSTIDSVFLLYSQGNEYPVEMIDNKEWGRINSKNTQSTIPEKVYIDNAYPLRNVYFYPTPSESKTIIFHNLRKLESFSSLTTEISLPDGYERAIVYNLALEAAPFYGKQVSQEVFKFASDSLADIKRNNIRKIKVGVDRAISSSKGYDIYRGS